MLRNKGCRAIYVRHVSTGDDFIECSGIIFLVPFLATKEALAPLTNDPIMQRRSIRSFRHIECQNLAIISDIMVNPIQILNKLIKRNSQEIKINYATIEKAKNSNSHRVILLL